MADTDAFFDNVLTYQDLTQKLKLSKRALERLVSKSEIPHKRIGRQVRFYWPDIVKWLSQNGARQR